MEFSIYRKRGLDIHRTVGPPGPIHTRVPTGKAGRPTLSKGEPMDRP